MATATNQISRSRLSEARVNMTECLRIDTCGRYYVTKQIEENLYFFSGVQTFKSRLDKCATRRENMNWIGFGRLRRDYTRVENRLRTLIDCTV